MLSTHLIFSMEQSSLTAFTASSIILLEIVTMYSWTLSDDEYTKTSTTKQQGQI